jgi:hypothetical protein
MRYYPEPSQHFNKHQLAFVDRGRWVPHKFSFAFPADAGKSEKKILRNDTLLFVRFYN